MDHEYKGQHAVLVLTDRNVIIKRGRSGLFLGGLRGEKTIPYSSIVAVQLKKAGFIAGYLQLSLLGGSEAKGGLQQAVTDENTVSFGRKSNDDFAQAKASIEQRMHEARNGASSSSADELAKYAELRNKGIITEPEFESKKKQLLGQ